VATFQQAVDLDPGYAPAWASLGYSTFRQLANGQIPAKQGFERARAAAQKAIALDPALADGYHTLALVQVSAEHDWAGARASIDQALRVDPENGGALAARAHLARIVGDVHDAVPLFRHVLERDPLNLLERRYFARVLYYAGELDEAQATVRRVLEMNPSFPAAHYELGRILLARGQVGAAVAEFEAEKTEGWREFGLPLGYHAQGRTTDAAKALQELVSRSAGSEYQVGETYAFFGDATRAFEWLNRAVDVDPGIQWLRADPLLQGITGDPRYAALLTRLNLHR
jgi:serine/threonine-protein kinase